MAKRRNFTDQFKAKIALDALRGDKTIQAIAAKHQLHPNQVSAPPNTSRTAENRSFFTNSS
jgi:transposase-like protein